MFRDECGRDWEVWDVQPTAVDPLQHRHHELRTLVQPGFEGGWLAFRAGEERRRLAPVPAGWTELADADLAALLSRACAPSASRRLVE